MIEIGGEFCERESNGSNIREYFENIVEGEVREFLLGRTAIDFIIKDILSYKECKKALLPDYLCSSMLEPFTRNGIIVDFYKATLERDVEIEISDDIDIIFLIQYFGFAQNISVKGSGTPIIIEDITHSMFLPKLHHCEANYLIGSLRKWMPINSGVAIRVGGQFNIDQKIVRNFKYEKLMEECRVKKEKYLINKDENLKNFFLNSFHEAENLIEANYENLGGADEKFTCDVNEMIIRRVENTKKIISEVEKIDADLLYFKDLRKSDAPLFVPIKLEKEKREKFRNECIMNRVYLPVHWPVPEGYNLSNQIFKNELSFICDQRYESSHIDKLIELLANFCNKEGL